MERHTKPDYRGIGAFVLLSFALAWAVTSPLWISGQGLRHPLAVALLPMMMVTPTIATLIVTRWISPLPHVRMATGLRLGKGRRWGWYWLFAWLGVPALVIAAPFVGALLGLFPLDVVNFSGFRALLEQTPGAAAALEMTPIQVIVGAQLASVVIAPLINAPFAFGEEWGWRGYLLPQLLPLGQWPALLISGVIWGLWHAPIILLGYNYPLHPQLGVLLMTIMCVILGVLFGWTRLATGSVWPAVLAHGALNGSAGVSALFLAEGATIDTAQVGITGWTGWLLPLLVIILLVVARRLPVRDAPDETTLVVTQPQGHVAAHSV
jgi:membrane protease YdiL (CAAX protease family)